MDWPQPRFLDLPDLRMAIYEMGEACADRPSIILCHGWPEIAYSWRHIMPALCEAGFHVVAPDQRGYGQTGNALSDKGDEASVPLYDMPHLCGDMAHLLDALCIQKAIFVGHDWGGIMMWSLPFYHPDRIEALIGVNTPFIPRLTMDPITAFRAAMGEDMYIVQFQNYGVAEKILDADIARALRFFYRRSSGQDRAHTPTPDEKNAAFFNLLARDESTWGGAALLSPQDLQAYIDAFTRTGFRGGINWYRNFSRNWQLSEHFEQKINVPCLMVCAENDAVLPPSMAEGMPKYIADLETHIIADCGHWTQAEKPDELNQIMKDWLLKRFG